MRVLESEDKAHQRLQADAASLQNSLNNVQERLKQSTLGPCGLPGCDVSDQLSSCSGCSRVRYCCRSHQVVHWKNGHKAQCKIHREMAALLREAGAQSVLLKELRAKELREAIPDRAPAPRRSSPPPSSPSEGQCARNDGLDSLAAVSQRVANGLRRNNFAVVDGLCGTQITKSLLEEFVSLQNAGKLVPSELAGGRSGVADSYQSSRIRGDVIGWFQGGEEHLFTALPAVLDRVDAVIDLLSSEVDELKPETGVELERGSAMVSCYDGSQSDPKHYLRHIDNPNADGRKVTALYYPNVHWTTDNGGRVCIFSPNQQPPVPDLLPDRGVSVTRCASNPAPMHAASEWATAIDPIADRLVVFWSDSRCPHEVQPSFKPRFCVTTWYYNRAERQAASAVALPRSQPAYPGTDSANSNAILNGNRDTVVRGVHRIPIPRS